MLGSDVNNTQFAGAMDPDAVMIARFYIRAVKNNFLTKKEARPIFEDKLYCEYYPAGSTLLIRGRCHGSTTSPGNKGNPAGRPARGTSRRRSGWAMPCYARNRSCRTSLSQ